jgi:hypothetical protein
MLAVSNELCQVKQLKTDAEHIPSHTETGSLDHTTNQVKISPA